ncbi:hypothetical protein PRK78_002658 [Emydomyces testavorans]|uniref:Glutamyl-tRNA amidotransferase complex subunit Gta3 domain-containing protein n=1 Tax=Emydomyces testavorans TaxID=2070801 RepID=A0AAF0DES4_9EURO|nr:hypothetical protein PRK78_002658 [Emydomyces testavorans]
MPPTLAARCSRAQLFQQHCRPRPKPPKLHHQPSNTIPTRHQSSSSSCETNLSTLLSQPTWSIKSLLPTPNNNAADTPNPPISRTQLHHLLRLSALPPPSSPAEESSMLRTLTSQIHFVKQIQQVDTTNVTPLRSIRDETDEARRENTIDLARLKDSLEQEEFVGRNRRIRRRRADKVVRPDGEAWKEEDALLKAGEKMVGRYFVVQSSDANGE